MPEQTATLGAEATTGTETSVDINSLVDTGASQTDDGGSTGTTDQTVDTTQQEVVTLPEDTEDLTLDEAMPAELRGLISRDAQAGPKIQQLWDRLATYSSLYPTVREAREIRDMFPGGAEEARSILSKAQDQDRSNALLESNDPGQQLELLSPIFESNPESFMGMLQVGANLMRERNPQLYNRFEGEVVSSRLYNEKFGEHLEGMASAIEMLSSQDEKQRQQGLQTLAKMTTTLINWGKKNGFVGKERDLGKTEATVDPRLKQFEEENRQLRQNQWTSFTTTVNGTAKPQIESKFRALIEPVLKNVPAGTKKATVDMLVSQSMAELEDRLKKDQLYQSKYQDWVKSKTFPDANGAVKFIVGRAQAHLTAVAKKILTPWSSTFIADKNAAAQKKIQTGARADVTGATVTTGRVNKSTLTPTEANSMDPKDILEWSRSQWDKRNKA